jgi:hypothetical protein
MPSMNVVSLRFPLALLTTTFAASWLACSDEVTPPPFAMTKTDAASVPDAFVSTMGDGGTSGSDVGVCVRTPAVSEYDIFVKPARAKVRGACTSKELTDIAATSDLAGLKAASSAACQACLISKEGDASWGPVVVNAAGAFVRYNFAACAELTTNAACGAQAARFQGCSTVACDKCISADDRDLCDTNAYAVTGICTVALNAGTFGACSAADLDTIDTTCTTDIDKHFAVLCGP